MLERTNKIFLFCLAGCVSTFANLGVSYAETIDTSRQPLAIQQSSVWQSTQIPVCWENPTNNDVQQRGWVQQAVKRTWETASAVRFTGWGQCVNTSMGIRIQIIDNNPNTKGLGNNLDGMLNGMQLNFTFNNFGTEFCQPQRQFCIETIAVHEFGHALGIAHEQNRLDRYNCNEDHQGTDPDYYVTPYDPASVMNYCNPNWSGNGQLSDLDRLGINIVYGKGTLLPDQYLTPNGNSYLFSSNGQYGLFCQGDGNLVLYKTSSYGAPITPIWASNTAGNAVSNCYMQADGNLVVNGFNKALWSSRTNGHPGAYLVVQNDGNVVIYEQNGKAIWATNTVGK